MRVECKFDTERLSVRRWDAGSQERAAEDLLNHLTEDARRWLPLDLAAVRTSTDAADWLQTQRNEHTSVLFAIRRGSEVAVAVLIASAEPECHIGYLVHPAEQGKGIASELVRGFCDWARREEIVSTVRAGVDEANGASIAVMAKCGFELSGEQEEGSDMLSYELDVRI